jgi:hypothetical protein
VFRIQLILQPTPGVDEPARRGLLNWRLLAQGGVPVAVVVVVLKSPNSFGTII